MNNIKTNKTNNFKINKITNKIFMNFKIHSNKFTTIVLIPNCKRKKKKTKIKNLKLSKNSLKDLAILIKTKKMII